MKEFDLDLICEADSAISSLFFLLSLVLKISAESITYTSSGLLVFKESKSIHLLCVSLIQHFRGNPSEMKEGEEGLA